MTVKQKIVTLFQNAKVRCGLWLRERMALWFSFKVITSSDRSFISSLKQVSRLFSRLFPKPLPDLGSSWITETFLLPFFPFRFVKNGIFSDRSPEIKYEKLRDHIDNLLAEQVFDLFFMLVLTVKLARLVV